jgi:hypothetical protein
MPSADAHDQCVIAIPDNGDMTALPELAALWKMLI